MKQCILNSTALQEFAKEKKIQPFKIKQILYEIFKNQNIKFEDMTTLSKDLRSDLDELFSVVPLEADKILEDKETTKIWFKTADGHIIESVIIYHRQARKYRVNNKPKLNRITLCISSQIWCPVNCLFCVTGKLGFTRNLTREEIIWQILFANNYIKNKLGKKEDWTLNAVRNVVFMWMGEPMLNYENVKKSIEMMLQQDRLSLSRKHVTISTAGFPEWIRKLIKDDIQVWLAISLHSADQATREKIMPIAKAVKLEDLMASIKEYVHATGNRIFYEYILIKWITDTKEQATKLINLLKNQLAHVNLIPYNENPAIDLKESEEKTISEFKNTLENWWLTVTVRDSMWRKVKSACWQLGYQKIKEDKDNKKY